MALINDNHDIAHPSALWNVVECLDRWHDTTCSDISPVASEHLERVIREQNMIHTESIDGTAFDVSRRIRVREGVGEAVPAPNRIVKRSMRNNRCDACG